MQKSTKWTGIGVAGALTAAALVIPGISAAQTDEATDGTDDAVEDRQALREEKHQEFIDALAEELGISSEELEEAFDAVREDMRAERLAALRERLDEKVAAGELTEEEADEIYEAAENGEFPGHHRRMHRRHHRIWGPHDGAADDGADATDDATVEGSSLNA